MKKKTKFKSLECPTLKSGRTDVHVQMSCLDLMLVYSHVADNLKHERYWYLSACKRHQKFRNFKSICGIICKGDILDMQKKNNFYSGRFKPHRLRTFQSDHWINPVPIFLIKLYSSVNICKLDAQQIVHPIYLFYCMIQLMKISE